jgi:glycosyltransferase involved in cell wall biosynthesis
MKITHLSTYDIEGGAGRAAYRLHKALGLLGVDSAMLVQMKKSCDSSVSGPTGLPGIVTNKLHTWLDLLPLKFHHGYRGAPWGVSWLPGGIVPRLKLTSPEIVHLHWGCCGFVPITTLAKIGLPLVWTMHDSWAFTGGCNIPGECSRYREECGLCPLLGSSTENDLSRWAWCRKAKKWKNLTFTIVAPSRWMAECARSSSLLRGARIEVIPNGLDLQRFKPVDKSVARELLGLPAGKKLILFGATQLADRNKGFHLLCGALAEFNPGWRDQVELVLFGSSQVPEMAAAGLKIHDLGRLHDDISLVLAYSAADAMCVPSLQESFGQTASEAMACGTPVVAFAATGLLDIVDHRHNGYLSSPYDCGDLAAGLQWVLDKETDYGQLGRAAREKAEREFSMEKIAARHLNLYHELLA